MSRSADHLAAFASRYADPTQEYLSAATALTRCEALLEDAAKLKRMFDVAEPAEGRWFPWLGAELISYYAVAFVTCLEWHARSRVVDLLACDRSARLEDFKGQISDKLIVEMMYQNAPISHLVGASINVPSFEKYLSIIGRIFAHFGVRGDVGDWLTGAAEGASTCWVHPSQLEELHFLFGFRNRLVHELGSDVMGHANVREGWSPDAALAAGAQVVSVIRGVESVITAHFPATFPNRLDEAGWRVSPLDSLREELDRLEDIADREIRAGEWNFPDTIENWEKARGAARAHLEAEEFFVERAEMLHWRYWDARMPFRLNALRSRIDFLRRLLDNFTAAHLDDPEAEIPATRRM